MTAFAKAVADNTQSLTKTRIGLGIVGSKNMVILAPTLAHQKILAEMRRQCDYDPSQGPRATAIATLRAWWAEAK